MTPTCHNCGMQNRSGAKFCRRCGQPLTPVRRGLQAKYLWLVIGGGLLVLSLLAGGVLWVLRPDALPGTLTAEATSTATPETGIAPEEAPTATESIPAPSSDDPTPTRGPLTVPGTDIEIPRLSEEEEIEIGQEVAREIEEEYGVYQNPGALRRVTTIGQRIIPHCDRPHLDYHFTLLDTDEINAFAVPGGFIYVTRGMLDFVESDDELAGVIGHEIAHVARRHGAQEIEAIALAEAAARVIAERRPDLADIYETEGGQIATQMTALIVFNGWSRQQEFEADEYGTIYMAQAGYEPRAILNTFRRMGARFEPDEPGPAERLLATHPPFDERIRRVEETITENAL